MKSGEVGGFSKNINIILVLFWYKTKIQKQFHKIQKQFPDICNNGKKEMSGRWMASKRI